ncbi:methyltransferase domain-containing protein [Streptomyces sp. NPDC052225]|uniref:methyltransferase domain-containing protein n=1 Tax=Streptomyces sp. NPDC052225 TaxID=3154949 RepID=UPI0034283AFD
MTPRHSGVRDVVAYNWPQYAAGLTAAATAAAVAGRLPRPVRRLARTGSAAALGLLAAATAASWCVYDRSDLYAYDWLAALLPRTPSSYAVVSCGLDEVSGPLAARWPGARQVSVDLYDPALTTEGSIRRARRRVPPPAHAVPGRPGALPLPAAGTDAVLLVFAAHELRRARDREALFAACARALRPGGTLILAEHLRDAANTAVFGPGAWHFLPRAEWLRLAALAGLRPAAERRVAHLVTAFAFTKPEPEPERT